MKTIVVGVDGSEGAAAALEFAAEEAALRHARLRIVSAWEVPSRPTAAGSRRRWTRRRWTRFVGAQQVADGALATVKELRPSLEGEALAVEGQPAGVLLEQAADAELIVVGNRGRGGFESLLLGSVSQQVVHHAACPVVVVNRPTAPS